MPATLPAFLRQVRAKRQSLDERLPDGQTVPDAAAQPKQLV